MMANKDVAIPIVFPDYLIMVKTPTVHVDIPDLLPGIDILPNRVKIPATKQKIPYLGHAGILFIDGSSGLTKYYEYGRYDPAAKGLVRKQMLSDVNMGSNGYPTKQSLEKVLNEISISCLHFMKEVAEAGGARMPKVIAPQPAGDIVQVRFQEKDLDFERAKQFAIEDVQLN